MKPSRVRSLRVSLESISGNLHLVIKDTQGALGVAILGFITLLAVAAPYLPIPNPDEMNAPSFQPPSLEHPLGTDNLGRDLLSRVIWGARTSLMVGVIAAGISAVIGILLGAIAGYFGGKIDNAISRIIEIFLMIPTFFLVILIVALYGSSVFHTMIVIGLTSWPSTARITRAQVMSVKELMFVEAARALGASSWRILFRDVLPNSIHPAVANTILQIGNAIIVEAALSYLGLGDPNNPSWGRIIYEGQAYILTAWWISLFPGIALVVTMLAINLLGEAFLKALTPKLKTM